MTVRSGTSARAARLQPLSALKAQIVALDAAMLVAVTSTEVGAVHKLRTATRRVQAQLSLMDLLGRGDHPIHLPEHGEQTHAVLRRLRRIRSAAGGVRDLDVQISIIRLDAPLKSLVHKGSRGEEARRQAKNLRKDLERQREEDAKKLISVLRDEEQQLAADLRSLEQAVKAARRRSWSPAVLLRHAESFFAEGVCSACQAGKPTRPDRRNALQHGVESLDEEALHAVRKSAKLARYMLEGSPEGTAARAAGDRFEALQEAGGRWHDWLLLQGITHRFHGQKAELTDRYAKHADAALAEYRLCLAELLPTLLV